MKISCIHFHDTRIPCCIEDADAKTLTMEVTYPVDWAQDGFEKRLLIFDDVHHYQIAEWELFGGAPTSLDAEIVSTDHRRSRLRLQTNAGHRELSCVSVRLIEHDTVNYPFHEANPARASRCQSLRPVRWLAEPGSFRQNNTPMKLPLLIILLLVLVVQVSFGDGIPWDRTKGRMTTPYLTLRLSERQMAEFRTSRSVTLTPMQHSRLQKRTKRFPARIISVVNYRYGDCTCCISHPYAIMLPGEYEIAIPLSEIARIEEHGISEPVPR